MNIKERIRLCSKLSDDDLWAALPRLVRTERRDVTGFLIHLMEVQRRDLHIKRAYPGLYSLLVKLGYSEWEARARSIAVGKAEKYRSILGLLQSGRLTLSTLAVIGPYLRSDNYRNLLRKACRRGRREVEALVAGLAPKAAKRDVVRVVSAPPPVTGETPAAPRRESSPSALPADSLFPGEPLSRFERRPTGEVRLRQSFDCSEELQDKIKRARELLSNKYPSGRLEFILDDALEALLEGIDPARRHARRLIRQRSQALRGLGAAGSA